MSNQPQGKIAVTSTALQSTSDDGQNSEWGFSFSEEDGEQSTDGMGGVIVVGDSMKEGNPEVDDDQSKFVTNHSMEKSFSQTKLQSDQKQLAVSIGNLSLQKGITSRLGCNFLWFTRCDISIIVVLFSQPKFSRVGKGYRSNLGNER